MTVRGDIGTVGLILSHFYSLKPGSIERCRLPPLLLMMKLVKYSPTRPSRSHLHLNVWSLLKVTHEMDKQQGTNTFYRISRLISWCYWSAILCDSSWSWNIAVFSYYYTTKKLWDGNLPSQEFVKSSLLWLRTNVMKSPLWDDSRVL